MRFIPYKQLNRLIQEQTFEASLSWGIRMAVAATVPIIWGTATGNLEAASWITLTAEAICWVELKGSFAQGMRVLLGGILLALVFSALGTLSADNIWIGTALMLLVGFLSGLFKNLGDRGSALGVSVFVLFIMGNALPVSDAAAFADRLLYVTIGGFWNLFVGIIATLIIPPQEPYRRTIALIWKANAGLVQIIGQGLDGKNLRASLREIYTREKQVRQALDSSLHFYESMAHQVSSGDKDEYQLAQIRKATSLVATHILAISDELESVGTGTLPQSYKLKAYSCLKALEETLERMAVYVILVKPEEELLLSSRMGKLSKNLLLLKEHKLEEGAPGKGNMQRIVQLLERTIRLIESSVTRLEPFQNELPVYRSYSLIKTLYILHPKHWWRNIKLLFNLNTLTARYAFRTAMAAALALFIYKWFKIDHGYWLPFTVIIVLQPYFGATFKKAIDRVAGTVAGGLVGGLLIRVPTGLYVKEFMLFVCFVLMVYYIRKRYSVAAFFITVSLVLLFDVEETINPWLILIRALSTVAGAAIAIVAGFALLPHWDRKYLPRNIFQAIQCNYQYFLFTFYSDKKPLSWTRNSFRSTSNSCGLRLAVGSGMLKRM
ncbi:MAG: hypothetical protein EOP49_17645 [Sphingobacteriales bacterium]|nr:MAG: hypothetical protein EOP49_17645 [Sphingobacteriales bacterium]